MRIEYALRVVPLLLAISVCCILDVGCQGARDTVITPAKQVGRDLDIASLAAAWKEDSSGCKQVRDRDKAALISSYIISRHYTRGDVLKMLGPPNGISGGCNGVNLVYVFDVSCMNGRMIDTLDYCWMNIVVSASTDSVVSINMPCS
jgi:hypothetical protein